MASYCQKCGYKLSMIDIKPECPVCGINLVYYGMEDSLKKEADKAEFEHATLQPRLDRLKAATIGSPLAITRLVICVLPLLATLLPMGKIAVNLPYFTEKVTVNIVSIISKVFMNLDFDFLMAMTGSAKAGTAYICYLVALVSFVLVLLMALFNLFDLIVACGKRGIRRNITVASIGLFFTVVGAVTFAVWTSSLSGAYPEVFSGTVAPWGILGVALAFAAEIVINVIYKKKNIKVRYKDLSEFLVSYDERPKTSAEEETAAEPVTE